MAVYINGSSANEVFYSDVSDVSLVGYVFNGVQLLAQTVAFLQGSSGSGNVIQGDISLFGGNNPLITSPTIAPEGWIPATSASYGFGIDATRAVSMSNAIGMCDISYATYATAVINDSGAVTIGIYITVPFSNYTLVGIGYVQAPASPKIRYIYIDSLHGTEIPANYYNAGDCTYMDVNINYTTNRFTLFTVTGTYQNSIGTAYHCFGDVIFRLSLSRAEYISWKNGDYKPPVHLNSNASIVRD